MPEFPKDFIDLCHSVTAKRPKTVIDHILEYGFITTEDLSQASKKISLIYCKKKS